MAGTKRSHSTNVGSCPPPNWRKQQWLQEPWRKRRQCETASAPAGDEVEPMEVDSPEDQEEPMQVDAPPAWLPWHHARARAPLHDTTVAPAQERPASPPPLAHPLCPALVRSPPASMPAHSCSHSPLPTTPEEKPSPLSLGGTRKGDPESSLRGHRGSWAPEVASLTLRARVAEDEARPSAVAHEEQQHIKQKLDRDSCSSGEDTPTTALPGRGAGLQQ